MAHSCPQRQSSPQVVITVQRDPVDVADYVDCDDIAPAEQLVPEDIQQPNFPFRSRRPKKRLKTAKARLKQWPLRIREGTEALKVIAQGSPGECHARAPYAFDRQGRPYVEYRDKLQLPPRDVVHSIESLGFSQRVALTPPASPPVAEQTKQSQVVKIERSREALGVQRPDINTRPTMLTRFAKRKAATEDGDVIEQDHTTWRMEVYEKKVGRLERVVVDLLRSTQSNVVLPLTPPSSEPDHIRSAMHTPVSKGPATRPTLPAMLPHPPPSSAATKPPGSPSSRSTRKRSHPAPANTNTIKSPKPPAASTTTASHPPPPPAAPRRCACTNLDRAFTAANQTNPPPLSRSVLEIHEWYAQISMVAKCGRHGALSRACERFLEKEYRRREAEYYRSLRGVDSLKVPRRAGFA